ncbi:MAG: hypothetical protein ACHQLQ_11890 [Candidatus Acidiferrales bacterium]
MAPRNQQNSRRIVHGPHATARVSYVSPVQKPLLSAASGLSDVSLLLHVVVIV